jgi:hypothetical protein
MAKALRADRKDRIFKLAANLTQFLFERDWTRPITRVRYRQLKEAATDLKELVSVALDGLGNNVGRPKVWNDEALFRLHSDRMRLPHLRERSAALVLVKRDPYKGMSPKTLRMRIAQARRMIEGCRQ